MCTTRFNFKTSLCHVNVDCTGREYWTRMAWMHSSRMRTVRSLPVLRSIRLWGVCPNPVDVDPLPAGCRPLQMQTHGRRPPWMQTPSPRCRSPGCRSPSPSGQTNTCEKHNLHKLHLRALKVLSAHAYSH